MNCWYHWEYKASCRVKQQKEKTATTLTLFTNQHVASDLDDLIQSIKDELRVECNREDEDEQGRKRKRNKCGDGKLVKGWSKSGIHMFNEIFNIVKETRNSIERKQLEEDLKQRFSNQTRENGTHVQRHFIDSNSSDIDEEDFAVDEYEQ